jgi:acyl carrier protein
MNMDDSTIEGYIFECIGIRVQMKRDGDRPLSALGIDSMATLELLLALEERTGLPIDPEAFDATTTLRQVIAWLRAQSAREVETAA